MVYLAACRTNGDAHASYYGVGIQDMLGEAENITAPTLIHIAGKMSLCRKKRKAPLPTGWPTMSWLMCIFMTAKTMLLRAIMACIMTLPRAIGAWPHADHVCRNDWLKIGLTV